MGRKKKREHESERGQGTESTGPGDDVLDWMLVERIETVRLLRALDAARIEPHEIGWSKAPGFAENLTRLAEFDDMLLRVMDAWDRKGPERLGWPPDVVPRFLTMTPDLRDLVLAALPTGVRARVLAALPDPAETEAEVWRQIATFREAVPDEADRAVEPSPDQRNLRRALLHQFFEEGIPAVGEDDERVRRQEAKGLPTTDWAHAWLERLPVGWLRAIAPVYGVDAGQVKRRLVPELEKALQDEDRLAVVIRDRLDRQERERLAFFVAAGEVPWDNLPLDVRTYLAVPWNWSTGLPPGVGAKLRAFGFVFVGLRKGVRTVGVPGLVGGNLVGALNEVDPTAFDAVPKDLMDDPGEELAALAEYLFPGAEGPGFDYLRRDDVEALAALHLWSQQHPAPASASDLFFGPGPKTDRNEDFVGYVDFTLLDFRAASDGRTLVERYLEEGSSESRQHAEILECVAAARPSLYRIERVKRSGRVELVDVFRGGKPVIVTDHVLAGETARGVLVPCRVFRVGRLTFARPCGYIIEEKDADAALRWLEARFVEWATKERNLDRNAFLRVHPEYVAQASLGAPSA